MSGGAARKDQAEAAQSRVDMDGSSLRLLVFRVEQLRCALELSRVERVVRAVAVTALPTAPAAVVGVMDMAGEVLPVLSLRRLLNLPDQPLRAAQHFLLVRAAARRMALVIDAPEDVATLAEAPVVPAAALAAVSPAVRGVVQLPEGLVLIQDLESFLTSAEVAALDEALEQRTADGC